MSTPLTKSLQMRECACGCGQPLTGKRSNARFLDTTHRNRAYARTRPKQQKTASRPFVALDGEGENKATGEHIYTLLATKEKDIASKQGLTTEQCLDFLLSLPRGSHSGKRPIYVWFSFDYDVNMILADLPLKGENSIEVLRRNNTVQWRGYRITYFRRKILRISRGKQRHTSYDLWGFFQTGFESALQNWGIETLPVIAEGKRARSGFARWSIERIREYNRAECIALEELAEKLRAAIVPLNLPIQSWHGPAALAAAWLRKNKVKNWLPKQNYTEEFRDVCNRAYFGGRIDVLGYGIVNPVYHYDIVSAYPSATRFCPNLSKIVWIHQGKGKPRGRLYVARIRWKIPTTYWPPFPWRSNNGSIRYPLEGEGWYWYPEVEMAMKKYGENHFSIEESYYARGKIEFPFMELIQNTFRYRQQLKAENHPSHIPVKLILNSLYGKFAQTVGKASYHSTIWAGIITSITRAQLMNVLDENVVCVMTDSIWSTKPLHIPLGSNLGDWEEQSESELVLAEAGLYEATNTKGEKHVWQRGFDKRNPVNIRKLVRAWLLSDASYSPSYTVNRFIGMGLASVTSYPWRHWIDIERRIEPVPIVGTTKRMPYHPRKEASSPEIFVKLQPRARDTEELSAPYSKVTLDEAIIRERLEDECIDE